MPSPAITPPAITTVSPGATRPTKAPVSRKAITPDQGVGPGTERLGHVDDDRLGIRKLARARRSRRPPARARADAHQLALAGEPCSSGAPRRPPPARAATAAAIWVADIRADCTEAACRLGSVRRAARSPARPDSAGVAAARSAAPRSANSPKQVGPDPLTAAPSAPAARIRSSVPASSGRSASAAGWRSFSEPLRQPPAPAAARRPQWLGVEPLPSTVLAVELGVDRAGRQPLCARAPAPRRAAAAERPGRSPRRPGPVRARAPPGWARRSPGPRPARAGPPRRAVSREAVGAAAARRRHRRYLRPARRPPVCACGWSPAPRADPAGSTRRRSARRAARVRFGPSTPGQSTRSGPWAVAGWSVTSSARSSEANSEQSECSPSARAAGRRAAPG